MERNDGGQPEANEFSGSGSTQPQESTFDFAGTGASAEQSEGIRERARNVVGGAGEKLADVGTAVRDRAGNAKEKLASALESGAERLRERTQGSGLALAGAGPDGTTAIQSDGKVAQVSDKVAGGMEATADWLREADLDGIKLGIERQVKEHPGRTLIIAAGLGYLIGRAFRGNQ